MGFCKFKLTDPITHHRVARSFLATHPEEDNWTLLNLQDMYNAGNDLEQITEVIPFRSEECRRSRRCCGVCTRKCRYRCVQDSLHRLSMWRMLVDNTPESELHNIQLGIRMIVQMHFDTPEELSWSVGEILSRSSNTKLKEYMQDEKLRSEENPYKIDYAPQAEVDPKTGKRVVNPVSGHISIIPWPASGLCPFCLPNNTIDRRHGPRVLR